MVDVHGVEQVIIIRHLMADKILYGDSNCLSETAMGPFFSSDKIGKLLCHSIGTSGMMTLDVLSNNSFLKSHVDCRL